MCCTRLAKNTGCKKSPKICHPGTIAQLHHGVSSQLRHVSTIGKKLVKQQYLLYVSSQYGELRPTNGGDRFTSLEHLSTFQRVSRLGSVTARHSGSGRPPNFASLNRGRHLDSTEWPSRWALAHILVIFVLCCSVFCLQFCCVRFIFFITSNLGDWLKRLSPKWYGDSAGNTIVENPSVFFVT